MALRRRLVRTLDPRSARIEQVPSATAMTPVNPDWLPLRRGRAGNVWLPSPVGTEGENVFGVVSSIAREMPE